MEKQGYKKFDSYKGSTTLGSGLVPNNPDVNHLLILASNVQIDEEEHSLQDLIDSGEFGDGGEVKPVDPTTVWELNAVPNYASLPNSSNKINVNFISNDEEFIAIYGAATGVRQGIYYVKSGGSTVVSYNSVSGWTNANYKTVTFPDRIEDETLLSWLPENGTLISGSLTPDEPEDDDVTDTFEMPIIKFVNARFGGLYYSSPIHGYLTEESPLTFTIEVIGGKLKEEDEVQVCVRRTYHAIEYDSAGDRIRRRKQKLRRIAWKTITADDINKRFQSVSIYGDNYKNSIETYLFHNDRNKLATRISPIYLRIRRPVGDLQANSSGMTVDAKFSNIIMLWKSYTLDRRFTIK